MLTATGLLGELAGEVTQRVEDQHGPLLTSRGPWREPPVDFDTFVEDPRHLGLPPLYPRQRAAVLRLLGSEPTRIFDDPLSAPKRWRRAYQQAVLLWGKGSGKDYLCSIIVAYLIYVLLCLWDPQSFFELAPGEPLDVINVAYNADQASKVFFTKLKARITRWRWLRENYNVFESGKRVGRHRPGRGKVEINGDFIEFPRKIRAWSRHAQNESYEGLNIIAWVMDEASAFLSATKRENAEGIHQTLKTSAASRFGMRWLGLIISYPRHADDFTMTKHREAEANPGLGVYADGPAMTWEINERTRHEPRVDVGRGLQVPASLANDFLSDFDEALSRYCCEPPKAKDAFFKFPERLSDAVHPGRAPLIEWEPIITEKADGEQGETRRYIGVRLTRLDELPRGAKLYGHGDPGISDDSFALAIGHAVPATIIVKARAGDVMDEAMLRQNQHAPDEVIDWEQDVVRTIIDALIVWRPDPRQGIQVDLENVEQIHLELKKAYPTIGHWPRRTPGEGDRKPTLTWDHWNSALAIQRMRSRRMNVRDEQWSRPFQLDIYRNARTAFYNSLVTLPDTPSVTSTDPSSPGAIYELERIELIEGSKVDHPQGGSKDRADAVVRVIQHATEHNRGAGLAFGTAFGHQAGYGKTAPMIRSTTPILNPATPPKLASEQALTAEEAVRRERPLGELVPAEGTVNGRKLAFGSITTRRNPAQ